MGHGKERGGEGFLLRSVVGEELFGGAGYGCGGGGGVGGVLGEGGGGGVPGAEGGGEEEVTVGRGGY